MSSMIACRLDARSHARSLADHRSSPTSLWSKRAGPSLRLLDIILHHKFLFLILLGFRVEELDLPFVFLIWSLALF